MEGARQEHPNHRLMRLATFAAVGTAATLIVVKLFAWMFTGSLAMLASLVDSSLDVAASLVSLMAVRHALQPADMEHRFGHGKAESIAVLAQAAFIGGSAVFLGLEAARRFATPTPVARGEIGIAVMLFSIAATLALVTFQRSVVKRTGSIAVAADSAHYTGDVLVNAGVVASLLLDLLLGWPWVDAAFAFAIALYLARNAYRLGMTAFDQIMDKEMPEADRARICEIALAEPGALALHDLRTRVSGPNRFIQMHVEVEGGITVTAAHDVANRVELAVGAAFASAEVLVHIDPLGVEEPIAYPATLDRMVSPELEENPPD